jgi:hypothetical protein
LQQQLQQRVLHDPTVLLGVSPLPYYRPGTISKGGGPQPLTWPRQRYQPPLIECKVGGWTMFRFICRAIASQRSRVGAFIFPITQAPLRI